MLLSSFYNQDFGKSVFNQLGYFLNSNGLFDTFQSGFGCNRNSSVGVLNDIRGNTHRGRVTVLVFVDLSGLRAAEDPVKQAGNVGRPSVEWFRLR